MTEPLEDTYRNLATAAFVMSLLSFVAGAMIGWVIRELYK